MLNFKKTHPSEEVILNKDKISLLNLLSESGLPTFPLIFLIYIYIYIYMKKIEKQSIPSFQKRMLIELLWFFFNIYFLFSPLFYENIHYYSCNYFSPS